MSLAGALLDAATRLHDLSDPQLARQAIAAEALQFVSAEGVIVIVQEKHGLIPVFHLTRTGPAADPDAGMALCLRLAAAQLLEPGDIPAQELHRVQQVVVSSVSADQPAPVRWRSALVADLNPRNSRPTRLLWYASTSDAFAVAADVAVIFARHAGLALQEVTERYNLQRAIESRTTTGQAAGILMHRYRITAEQAFAILRRYSQEHNLKLRDVAETINRTGELSL